MSVDLTLGGHAVNSVKVEYSPVVFAAENAAVMNVQALLDRVTQCTPGDVQFSGDDDENGNGKRARARASNFVGTKVRPGTHTIKLQWRSSFRDQIFTHKRSMSVQYK